MPKGVHRPFYTKSLVLITLNVIAVSAILAAYDVEIPIRPTVKWAASHLYQIKYIRGVADWVTSRVGFIWKARPKVVQQKRPGGADKSISELMTNAQHLPVFTHDQLALFDGTRPAKPVYLAILGRIYDVEKGRKHYAPGGGYHFFSGKDATRAFVTGDFTPEGLVDDVSALSEQDLLSILDWIKFYEKDYKLVGVLQDTYYDAHGKLTEAGQNVLELLERAAVWKEKQLREQEVFPPCNSECFLSASACNVPISRRMAQRRGRPCMVFSQKGPSGCVFKQNINRERCDRGPYMRSYVNGEWGSRVWDMETIPEINRGGAGPTQMFEGEEWKDARAAVEKFKPAVSGYEAFVNLWCMMPSVVCEDALKDCRSVILASGTLCPTETFKTELGIEFKLHMEGDQVISKDRIFATAIAKGPRGNSLCAVYRNLAPQSSFYSELAQILLEVCQTVPKGVLCFVSSYRILDLLMQTMRTTTYMQRIEQKKVVIEEPRRSSDLALTMQKFDDAIESPQNYGWECDGALMIAVYRGKVSEGIDFTDDKARCVVCVGIPFPNTKDEVVVEKKKFNDENRASHRLISGDQWYSTQAYRALNQALGRCLRHKNDWGALLLVDERFVTNARSKEPQSESQKISKWVRENLRIHRGYHEFKADLDRFVQMRMSIDADTADVKDVKPFKPMPTLDDEERSLSSFSDVVDSNPPASANPLKPRVNPLLRW